LLEELEALAGVDPQQDRFRVGYLAAVNDILNIDIEEVAVND